MSNVGQRERATQNCIVQFFQTDLGYRYLVDYQDRPNNKNIEVDILVDWPKMQFQRGGSQPCDSPIGMAAALQEGKMPTKRFIASCVTS